MATYYIYTDTGPTRVSYQTKANAERDARTLRRAHRVSTRVLLRCDHRFPGVQFDGPDSERHMGLHYRVVARFPVRVR